MPMINRNAAVVMPIVLGLLLGGCPARDEPDEPWAEETETAPEAWELEREQDPELIPTPPETAPDEPPEVRPEELPPAERPAPPPTPAPDAMPPPPAREQPAPPQDPTPEPPAAAPPPTPGDHPGRVAFVAHNCQRCHSVSTAGIDAQITTGRVAGGDLSASAMDRDSVRAVILRQQEVDGRRHPGDVTLTEQELQTMVDWLVTQRR
jgi:outer membrane biosynthesis protein TonB